MSQRPPLPPFTSDTAAQKARAAEDAWNTRNPEKIALAYTEDSTWRNRAEFIQGRHQIVEFLTGKWQHELDYRLMKTRIASINDLAIKAANRKFHWPSGRRPDDHPGLSALGL